MNKPSVGECNAGCVWFAQMEVIVNRKKRKVDGEKIFSIVASLAIVAALVVGVISIVKTTSNSKKQNYIDLNVAENTTTDEDKQIRKRNLRQSLQQSRLPQRNRKRRYRLTLRCYPSMTAAIFSGLSTGT